MMNIEANTVAELFERIIANELIECDDALSSIINKHTRDYILGFKRGLKRGYKYLFNPPAMMDLYGKLKVQERNEYCRKKMRPMELRKLKGELHSMTSMRDMVLDAMEATQHEVHKDKARLTILDLIMNKRGIMEVMDQIQSMQ